MLKRKREDEGNGVGEGGGEGGREGREGGAELVKPDGGGVEDRAVKIRKSRFAAQLEHSKLLLQRALKVARGFERQKLGRRQKTAKENQHEQELRRLQEEVSALKELDLVKTSDAYLFKQLARTKRIRQHPDFVGLYGKDAEGKLARSKLGAEERVVSRLMNSNPVKETMPGIMVGIYGCLGLEPLPSVKGNRQNQSTNSLQPREGPLTHYEVQPSQGQATQPDASTTEKTGVEHTAGCEMRTEAVSVPDESAASEVAAFPPLSESYPEHINISETAKGSSRTAKAPSPRPSAPSSKQQVLSESKSPGRVSNTTFLPSLTLGGYFSGSDDSDFNSSSDSETKARTHHIINNNRQRPPLGPDLPHPRNNRRGQRARQQIAERKYGSKAKHLSKDHVPNRDMRTHKRKQETRRPSNPNPIPTPDQPPTLHPSWQAALNKKKQQRMIQIHTTTSGPTSSAPSAYSHSHGTKIRFD